MVLPNGQIVFRLSEKIIFTEKYFSHFWPATFSSHFWPATFFSHFSGPAGNERTHKNRSSSGEFWNFITKQLSGTWAGQRQSPGRGAPGRPGPLHYEPNQNGRKSGRGGFEGPKEVVKVFGFPEKPPRSAGKHSREGGDKHKVCVSRPRGGKSPGKHAKTTVFNPTPGTPVSQGCKPRRAASPNNKLCSLRPRTGLPTIARGHRKSVDNSFFKIFKF